MSCRFWVTQSPGRGGSGNGSATGVPATTRPRIAAITRTAISAASTTAIPCNRAFEPPADLDIPESYSAATRPTRSVGRFTLLACNTFRVVKGHCNRCRNVSGDGKSVREARALVSGDVSLLAAVHELQLARRHVPIQPETFLELLRIRLRVGIGRFEKPWCTIRFTVLASISSAELRQVTVAVIEYHGLGRISGPRVLFGRC